MSVNENEIPSWMNPEYTLERFIRGKSNELVLMACQGIILNSGKANPLYIYGESGTGKTHLLHAVSRALLNKNKSLKIKYCTVADFQEDFLRHLSDKKTLEFKAEYKSYDVLIVEDLQFFKSSAESTQEEFFYVFNSYYESGKQILLSSDRPASELDINPRLASRFVSGLHVKIDIPDRILRKNFLEKKSESMGLALKETTVDYLTGKLSGSIRELESALNKLYFLNLRGININNDKELSLRLNDLIPAEEAASIDLDLIARSVCEKYSISREDLLGYSRRAEFTTPRHVAMYIAVHYSGLNKSSIARYFKRSDHSTVINAEKKIGRLMESNTGFQTQLQTMLNEMRKSRG